jgi:general secretion pathway protein D
MTKKKIFMLTALVCSALAFQRLIAQDDEFLLDEDLLLDDTPVAVDNNDTVDLVVDALGSGESEDLGDLLDLDDDNEAPAFVDDAVADVDVVTADVDEDTEELATMNDFGDLDSDVTARPRNVVDATLDGDDADINTMIQLEINKKQAETAFGIRTFKEAEVANKNQRYAQAIRLYKEANKYLNNSVEARSYKDNIPKRLGETYYSRSLVLLEQGDYQIAENNARESAQYGYSKAPALVKKCVEYQESPPVVVKKDSDKEWAKNSYKDLQKDVSYFLVKGKEYMAVGNYDEATLMFEGVLALEPYNRDAIKLLETCGRSKYSINTKEVEATRANMMAEVRDTWSPRSYVVVNKSNEDNMGSGKPKPIENTAKIRIVEKMENIIIPELSFRQANIVDVIEFLQRASIECDTTDCPPEEKGVNIILNLGGDAAPVADMSEPDPFAIPDANSGDTGGGSKSITFSSRYISLLEALRIVTEISQLKYRIDGSVVMIVPQGAADGKIIVKTYNVLPSVEDKIPSVGNEMSIGGGGVGQGGFGLGDDTGMGSSATVPWKDFFQQMGVKWPDGSQIKYIRSIGKIVVANTEDNLVDFERILNELNVVPNQIEIEARFVEVNEADMNSLGFEWFLNDDYTVASQDGSYAAGSAPRVDISANDTTGGFTTGNRFITDVVSADSAAVSDSVLSIAGILTNPELGLVVHALEQKGHADLLSSPKVTTQTGQEATIKVVTEYIYPTAYEVTPVTGETDNDTSVIIGGIVEPQDFQMREVGVILTVQPDVSPEGQMITLNMTPEVVTEPDWKNYGTTYTDQDGNTQQLNMEQPFFHTRLVQTSISIYNGATVVMGGMITEQREDTVDKIPFLGDIPFIGVFFQSKTSQSAKRNLLIFVTARLVDPAGRPVEDSSADLIADKLQEEADKTNE